MDFFLILYKSRLFYFSTGTGSVSPKNNRSAGFVRQPAGLGAESRRLQINCRMSVRIYK